MLKLLKYYKYLFALSGIILVLGLASMAIYGFHFGIDFKGGSILEVKFKQSVNNNELKTVLESNGVSSVSVQDVGENGKIIKSGFLEPEKHRGVEKVIVEKFGEFEEVRFENIGPVIGKDLRSKAIKQLILVSLGILLYIAYAFRKVARPITPLQFGVAAIIALLHDLLIVVGIFSILGHYKGIEIDSLFITALLTVLGFSIHDTIVVFDRIRENLRAYGGEGIEFVVNHSISQTIARSLNTSLTVLFVLFTMLIFGGQTIFNFVLALFIGIAAGTYSSIFVASPLLLLWHKWKMKSK